MTTESLGTVLIVFGVVLALLELPLIIGAARIGASHKRLLDYAAQLRARSGTAVVVKETFSGRRETFDPGLVAQPNSIDVARSNPNNSDRKPTILPAEWSA